MGAEFSFGRQASQAASGAKVVDDEEPETEDARTLPVLWSLNGYRARPFQDAARMLEVSEMDEKDFPLDGPRSSSWFITSMANSGTTPLLRHARWIAE